MIIKNHQGKQINSNEDWFNLSPPAQGKKQWKPKRSAYELARVWTQNGTSNTPKELLEILSKHPLFEHITFVSGTPEKVTRLDEFNGGHRNHDLVLIGELSGDKIVVSIEAKADESFGDIIQDRIDSVKGRSNLPKRISNLTNALFGDSDTSGLRYQLLHGIAGTLIEAKNLEASYAIFLVHEFISDGLNLNRVQNNQQDLNDFVNKLDSKINKVEPGNLLGPFSVPGGGEVPSNIPLFIGKIVSYV